MDIPKHQKIHEVLKDLNSDIYKSKNRFLVNAVERYIDSFEKEDLTKKGSKEKARGQEYIRREELDAMKDEIRYELMTEVRNEVIKLLGGVLAGMHLGQEIQTAGRGNENKEEQVVTDVTMENLAIGWSEEEEETT
jgi:hypothetical protein